MDTMKKDPVSKSPPSRSFTWTRIAALLVTIVLLTGLTYLRVSSSPFTSTGVVYGFDPLRFALSR